MRLAALIMSAAILTMGAAAPDRDLGPTRTLVLMGPLTVTGLDGAVTTFSPSRLADLPRATANLRSGDKATPYEGVLLSAVLKESGVPSGPRLHGKPVAAVVVITAADGYRVVLSLAETDASFRDGAIILADRKADGPLDADEGPYRLVIDVDKRPERSIRQVQSIRVVPAP